MKILMVNKFLYPRGGAETYMLRIGEELTRRGHQVEYFGMYDEKNTVGNAEGLTTVNMDFHASGAEKLLYPFRIIYSGEARRKMRQVIDRFHPDIIHFNNINFQLTPSVILAGAEKKYPDGADRPRFADALPEPHDDGIRDVEALRGMQREEVQNGVRTQKVHPRVAREEPHRRDRRHDLYQQPCV